MGIQSFKFPIDFLNNLEKPVIFIAKKDKTIVNSVSVYDGLKLTFNLNTFQTAEFKIYKEVDGVKQDYFKDFEEEMLIMIPGISWYEIHAETNIEQTGISKSITATSIECQLCDKRLIDFECNAGEILYDDYVKTIFFDPSNPKGSLLHRVLNVSPNWSVGHVDASLANKQRTFDVDDTDVYSFLTGEVSEAFNCLFIFDTFNCTVNAYDLDNYGKDTDIFVSMDNLAQNMTETIDQNSIFTCYRVNGGDGVYINEVNPNGTNKIYNFEYYLPQMSPEIRNKVIAYNNKYQALKPQYEDIMLRMQTQVDIIQELYTRLPESFASKDWTQYGLSFLESKQKSFKTQDELFCAQGMNKPQSLSYNLYKQNLQDLNDVTAELNVRQSEINSATALYDSIKAERNSLQEQLDMDNWFTVDEWKSLDNYVIEATYDNDNYIVTDLEDDSERLEIERQLYDVAWKDLSKKCRPQYQYSATLSNILTIPEFKDFVKYFELGNFIRMETDYDTIVKLRIISFTVDYSNTQTIDVTFSDAIRVKDIYEDSASIQAQANSAAMSFQFNKDQYDKTVKQGNFVAEMRKYGLDVATTAIHNSKNQSQVWDDSGMTFRMWNDERQDFDPEQIKIINNQIVFSDDGFNTVRMALGKIALGDNEYGYGLNAEILMSKLVMSQNLWIENDSGTYKFDDAGFNASNGKNTIKIQPNNSGELFSIYKGSNKQFYINSSGDVEFSGMLRGASGQFAGLISGGEININNTFTVDKDGRVTASSGTFGGLVSGGSININDKFIVDKNGNVTAKSGSFGGTLDGANGTFSGTLNAADGSFSGNITGSSGTFGNVTLNSNGLSSSQFSIDAYGNATFSGKLSSGISISSPIIQSDNFEVRDGEVGVRSLFFYDDGFHPNYSSGMYFAYDRLLGGVSFHGNMNIAGRLYAGQMPVVVEDDLKPYATWSVVYKELANCMPIYGGGFTGGIYSETAGSYSCGTSSKYWGNIHTKNFYCMGGDVRPHSTAGNPNLGSSSYKWGTIYATNGTIQTSDENKKHNIKSISEKYENLFFKIEPVSYVLNGRTRTHIGAISQSLEKAMCEVGLSDYEFAGFCKDIRMKSSGDNDDTLINDLDENGNIQYDYALRYQEFIMLNTHMIQKLYKRVEELENIIKSMN